MEFHERMAIVHAGHVFWNPISDEGVEDLIDAMALAPGTRVLDVACGAGELLVRLAERYGVRGVGVDVSAGALAQARAKAHERVPDAELEFVEQDGATYEAPPESFDAVCLVGASWIWKGYVGTLQALVHWLKPGGILLFGEPYWKPGASPVEYCEADGSFAPDTFTTLAGVREAAEAEGLQLVYMVGSSDRDWDRYEMLQSLAADRWVRANPDHPDLDAFVAATQRDRTLYLRWGRDLLGFAQFVFRRI
ncbi:MAG: SAM-dependent methyltransferase [Planctomycetota bacterium]|jgi:SAM-dependent methyltransferase